jgi:hypothetical protein
VVGEVHLGQAELAHVVWDEGLEDSLAAALVEEGVVADEDVGGLEDAVFGIAGAGVGGGDFREEAVDGGETSASARGAHRGCSSVCGREIICSRIPLYGGERRFGSSNLCGGI